MLAEINVALPPHRPRLATPQMMDEAAVRVSMGCLDDASCPMYIRRVEVRDWALPDPGRLDDPGFRKVRDQVADRVRQLREELIAMGDPPSSRSSSRAE